MNWRDLHELVLSKQELDCLARNLRILIVEAEANEAYEKEEAAKLRDILAKCHKEIEHG
jgi:hypothetical protein